MTISDIVVNVSVFREVDDRDFGTALYPTDADIEAIKIDISRQEMEYDLYNALGFYGTTRTSQLNTLIASYQTEFQTLLMYCVLKNFYFSNVQGVDERDNLRYNDFKNRYKLQLDKISSLNSRSGNKINIGRVNRV